MGRRPHNKSLYLWMNGLPVGIWETTRDGEQFTYFEDWIADEQGRPLSLSLPFTAGNQPYRGNIVSDYFDNLLPDSKAIRERIAGRYKTGGTTPFQLLAKLGRDCVGAIQMLRPDEAPVDLDTIRGRPLDESEIAQLLRETTAPPLLGHHEPMDDLRLSIAGAQEKTALLWHEEQWLLPEGRAVSIPSRPGTDLEPGSNRTAAFRDATAIHATASRSKSSALCKPFHKAELQSVDRRGGPKIAYVAGIIAASYSIAFQINLLSLNAAVEAALAGAQGHGYAIRSA